MALALTLVGELVRPAIRTIDIPLALIACCALVGWAVRAVAGRGLPFPYRAWQVPHYWRYTLPPVITLGAFGYLLGLGWLTYMVLPTFWLLVGGTIAVASLPAALGAWMAFALGRFLTVMRGAGLVANGIDEVEPHNFKLTRTAAAILLASAAVALTMQVV